MSSVSAYQIKLIVYKRGKEAFWPSLRNTLDALVTLPRVPSYTRHRWRRMAHDQGKYIPEEIRGTPHSKAMPVDAIAQRRILDTREDKKVINYHKP